MLDSFVRPTPMTDRLYEYMLSVSLREPEAFRDFARRPRGCPNASGKSLPSRGRFWRCSSN